MSAKTSMASAVAIALSFGVGATAFQLVEDSGDDQRPVFRGEASTLLPGDSVSDWVTYADQVAVVSVHDERQRPMRPWVKAYGEGTIGRDVTIKIERTLWRRDEAPEPPKSFSLLVTGWVVVDGKKHDFQVTRGSRIEPNHRYIMPLARFPSGEWYPISPVAVLPYDDERIGNGEHRGGELTTRAAKSQRDRRADDLAKELAKTAPDPAGAANGADDDDPLVRFARAERGRLKASEVHTEETPPPTVRARAAGKSP